ncbi:hypothetical protein [Mycoplasma phocimorsus]|uniref:hypothetical protein n=1 Tax=Mycoplasma phocimorsus TaxID=3045839 RepID=UPI0024C0ADBB|nr:hypothetical protein [Mycoplasma phocimorsus]MDJ1646727.1 hypothetical protein [Mycoplasma phocimorsus]MDJ1648809.1 hypothetical protein [Mycoplasma phocimorsus]
MNNKIKITPATKSEWSNITKNYKKGSKYIVNVPNLGNLLCNVYNNLKETKIDGEVMWNKKFDEFQNKIFDLINNNNKNTIKVIQENDEKRKKEFKAYKIEAEKQRKDDKIELQNQFTNMLKAYREETVKMFEKAEKQHKADKEEWNQKFNLLTTLIKTNHTEITDRLDKLECDVKMLKSFHKKDIEKYAK